MKNVFVTVNYDNVSETKKYIESFINSKPTDIDILYVVDNSPEKNQCRELEISLNLSNVKFLYPMENLGYMAAGSYAYDFHFNVYGLDFEYFCLMNNDIVFDTNDFSLKLLSLKLEGVMLISPSVFDENKDLNPYIINRKTSVYMHIWSFILSQYIFFKTTHMFISFFKRMLSGRVQKKSVISRSEHEYIYGTHGSVFILNNNFFKSGGSIRKLPFLYGEEIYISEQVRKLDGKCLYVPELQFSHVGSATLGKQYSLFKYKCIKNAHKFLCEEFYR